jgi:hypothetical protein
LKWGYDTIYPNIYAVLAGRSGRTRKGTAMRIGKRLLSQLNNVNIVSESVTREALIRFMKDSGQNFSDPTSGIFKMHSSIVCFSEELQVFLGERNIKFLADLTDWYDSSEMWTYQTKGCGTDKISGICFTLLGASAPDWFDTMFPPQAIGGGVTSRVIFIWEDDKKQTVPEPKTTEDEVQMGKALLKDLEQVMLLGGEFLMTRDAKDFYVEWYLSHECNMRAGNPPISNPIFSGYCERRATHIRKVSMLCSAARGDDMTISSTCPSLSSASSFKNRLFWYSLMIFSTSRVISTEKLSSTRKPSGISSLFGSTSKLESFNVLNQLSQRSWL